MIQSITVGLLLSWAVYLPQRVNASDSIKPNASLLYEKKCAACHENPPKGARAPKRSSLGIMSPEFIYYTLTDGAMIAAAGGLSDAEKRSVAEYLSGKVLGVAEQDKMPRCKAPVKGIAKTMSSTWNGWGNDLENSRSQSAEFAGLGAEQVKKLKVKWAFGFPKINTARAQPLIWNGRLFVGSASGTVYSLDAKTGCVFWTFAAKSEVRSAISYGDLVTPTGRRNAIFFGDTSGIAYSLDAIGGQLIWKNHLDHHPLARITGAPVLYGDTLIVPMASVEEAAASAGKDYKCCTFRGSVSSLDAITGKLKWKVYTIPKSAEKLASSTEKSQKWGPSGGGVWSAPTIDTKLNRIYFGTGNNYSGPDTNLTDSIIALDFKTGKLEWSRQLTSKDVWVLSCESNPHTNCPQPLGPDYDFGASPILQSLSTGKRILVAGQKSGLVFGFDPDDGGKLIWEKRVSKGGTYGGIQWGMAADSQKVYVAVSDVLGAPELAGGIWALSLSDGKAIWHTPGAKPLCVGDGCSPAQSAAVTVIPGAVFSGSVDGHFRAYSTSDGALEWDYDTKKEFATVNNVKANGGSLDGPGSVVVDGAVYVNSGYDWYASGNVLLSFTPDGK